MKSETFQQLEQAMARGGSTEVLDRLSAQLREAGQYHELFEALKMQLRTRLGLPLLFGDGSDELDESRRAELEEGLIAACREVGLALLRQGKIREGWMYLRAVGDIPLVARELAEQPVDQNNLDEMIEVTLHEAVDPRRGFCLVLEHYGTCNAITTFESVMPRQRRADQQAAAAALLEHLHAELRTNVAGHIEQEEGQPPSGDTLEALIATREWLFGEYSYHVDTTHLASTVRVARLLRQPDHLRLALDLTCYGRRLSGQFQYPGDEPFAEFYPSHALFFAAQLGEHVEPALDYFRKKADEVDTSRHGTVAIEVYVDLLARIGRPQEAIEAMLERMPPESRPMGLAPSLVELSQQAGDYERLRSYCRERGDMLGFATALVLEPQERRG